MTDTQLQAGGMDIAPDVLDTIVALAIKDVRGIASVGQETSKIRSLFASKQDQQGVMVNRVAETSIEVSVNISVFDGYSLETIAHDARQAIADAILSQTGFTVDRVDIHVDSIIFKD